MTESCNQQGRPTDTDECRSVDAIRSLNEIKPQTFDFLRA